ncbi:fasciclin domain-containing protein [Pelagibacterium xiamenense]|uniref:fasciclin domain-containing protein n=1 Tax=Pelagibacterium xiamenense TaxID=2901140 RepID=UPI001E47B7A3|nr:fasciclin domain-containing protein [Pelagibacterium xiamenense]MCD7058292.1 fasciclin domain-containing protein [Pelagibacterium xiamenense]
MTGSLIKTIAVLGMLAAGAGHAPMAASQDALVEASPIIRIGGAEMRPDRNIIENLVNSDDHTLFFEGLTSTGLASTLQGPGQFTVFAPTDLAFRKLPRGLVDALFTPEESSALRRILSAHVVLGRYSAEELLALAERSGGGVALQTLSGDVLGFQAVGGLLYVVDERLRPGRATIRDVPQSNGILHVVDSVLVPQ